MAYLGYGGLKRHLLVDVSIKWYTLDSRDWIFRVMPISPCWWLRKHLCNLPATLLGTSASSLRCLPRQGTESQYLEGQAWFFFLPDLLPICFCASFRQNGFDSPMSCMAILLHEQHAWGSPKVQNKWSLMGTTGNYRNWLRHQQFKNHALTVGR